MEFPLVLRSLYQSLYQSLSQSISRSLCRCLHLILIGSLIWVGLIAPAESSPIRIMAANTTSGRFQSYDLGEGIRLFQGLKPDIILIQEWNYRDNRDIDVQQFVELAFGEDFDYFREAGAQIANGVISRFPILDSGEWPDREVSNRDFAWARIDVPGERDLWAVSVHWLTRNAAVRDQQAQALVQLVREQIPPEDYLVIGGDFNTKSRREPGLATLQQMVITDPPYPVDQSGREGTNASRRSPYDAIYVDLDLAPFEVPVRIGENLFPSGLVFDSRVYRPLSDVEPVRASDSDAEAMQHMAVIRDFELGEREERPDLPQTSTKPKLVDQIAGELAETDPLDTSNRHVDQYCLSLTLTLDVESEDFDTVLRLRDPQGELIDENDDIEGSTNSQIIWNLPCYGVEVSSYLEQGKGAYELTIR